MEKCEAERKKEMFEAQKNVTWSEGREGETANEAKREKKFQKKNVDKMGTKITRIYTI